jgi:hypothetical protein
MGGVAGAAHLVACGAACVLHGYIRAARDVDILIELTEENAARISQEEHDRIRELSRARRARVIPAERITVNR